MPESIAQQALNHSILRIVDKIEPPKAVVKSASKVQITQNKALFDRQKERNGVVSLPLVKQVHETIDGVVATDIQSRQQDLQDYLPDLDLFNQNQD